MLKLNKSLIVAALLLMVPLFAGKGGGGGSFSSGSSSRSSSFSSSSSSSRPSSYSSPSSSSKSSGLSYGSFSSKPSATATASKSGGGSFSSTSKSTASTPSQQAWVRSQQSTQAAAQSKASLAQFKTASVPPPSAKVAASPVFSRVYTTSGGTSAPRVTYNTYVIQRQGYYSSYHPNPYVYNYRPSYGAWDAMFMWMMLDNMNSQMYYNHRNDADYQQWRIDANKQAQTDAAVAAKLADMDAKVKALEAAKTPVDPAYMPQGVDPSIAMAPDFAAANLTQEAPVSEPAPEASGVNGWVVAVIIALTIGIIALGIYIVNRPHRGPYKSRYDL